MTKYVLFSLSITALAALLSSYYIVVNSYEIEGNGFVLTTEVDHDYICVFPPYTHEDVMKAQISTYVVYVESIDQIIDDGIFFVILIKDGYVTARIRHRRIFGDYEEGSYGCRPAVIPTKPGRPEK